MGKLTMSNTDKYKRGDKILIDGVEHTITKIESSKEILVKSKINKMFSIVVWGVLMFLFLKFVLKIF